VLFIGLFRCCYFESASCKSACHSELCQRFLKLKNVWKIKKTLQNVKNVTIIKKRKKRFCIYAVYLLLLVVVTVHQVSVGQSDRDGDLLAVSHRTLTVRLHQQVCSRK